MYLGVNVNAHVEELPDRIVARLMDLRVTATQRAEIIKRNKDDQKRTQISKALGIAKYIVNQVLDIEQAKAPNRANFGFRGRTSKNGKPKAKKIPTS